jgi:MYXO-CTERM domain-containing protein
MDRMRRLTAFLLIVLGGCIGQVDDPVTQRRGAVGEPMNGFPSALERLGLMAVNRARSDPQTVKGPQSASYPARPPVIWSAALNQSARFHATSLELSDVTLMHTSPCTLNTNVATSGCSGDPSCACATPVPSSCAACAQVDAVNTCGTPWNTRVGYFTAGSGVSVTGEVAAAGYANPMTVVDGWMDEAAGSDGHRMNLTDQGITSNTMGYGHATGTKECYSPFDISDSGSLKNAVIPKLPTAAVSPASGAAGTFTFYATWADPALGAPSSINAVVDGACTALTRELGTDTLNATYKGTATLATGCHNYWIAAKDMAGATQTYPTTGAITISVGSTACSSDYLASAPSAACAAVDAGVTTGGGGAGDASGGTGGASGGPGGTSGGAGASGARGGSGGTGRGGAGESGTAGTPGAGGAAGDTVGAGVGGAPTPDASSGCACGVAPAGPAPTGAGLLILAWLLTRRRRTRT